jgi:hypothetical protein
MDAIVEIERLLRESGAVLVRQGKHLVYRLPNGSMFTRGKTPSDHRAPLNELSELRRALGISRERRPEEIRMNQQEQLEQATMPPQAQPSPQITEPADPRSTALRARVEAVIAREEAVQERLLTEAACHERRVHMLKALLPFTDDPTAETALKDLLPAAAALPAPAPAADDPPQQVTERVQVTRQLVFAATQTFDDVFTINDVMALMTGGRQIDSAERARIRSSIAQCIISLYERGEILKEQEHLGRRQTVWRKAQVPIRRTPLRGNDLQAR